MTKAIAALLDPTNLLNIFMRHRLQENGCEFQIRATECVFVPNASLFAGRRRVIFTLV